MVLPCLLYTSDAVDDTPGVHLGGRRGIEIKKKNTIMNYLTEKFELFYVFFRRKIQILDQKSTNILSEVSKKVKRILGLF